jgi:hypothetical protein
MIKIANIDQWLIATRTTSEDKRYFHYLLREDLGKRGEIINDLKAYIHQAHEDARRRLRKLAGYTLDPLEETLVPDSSLQYPASLDLQVLKGFFGEIMAGLVAEHFSPLGQDGWEVPAYLFRYHRVAFEQLEARRQTDEEAHPVPGRTGDDCLAFRMDDEGRITNSLYCEAKCTHDHDSSMITEAHHKVSAGVLVNILELIEILSESDDTRSKQWIDALRRIRLLNVSHSYERSDLVSYACGRAPVQQNRGAWISPKSPHADYTGGRRLQAVEIHLNGVDELVKEVYGKKD